MHYLKLLQKQIAPIAILLSTCASAAQTIGLVGGQDSVDAFAGLVSDDGTMTPITGLPSPGNINSVAINDSLHGIIGGQDNNGIKPAYAAIISPSGVATTVFTGTNNDEITSVAINASSVGIIGGQNFLSAYAALVSSSGVLTPVTVLPVSGKLFSVAINPSSEGLVGGFSTTSPYAAQVSPLGVATPIVTGVANGFITSVALNAANQGLIGGKDNTNPAYAAQVSSGGIATPIATGIAIGTIDSVALNDSNNGIIGGLNGAAGYAALVPSTGAITILPLGLTSGEIFSVAINPSSEAIIGGKNNTTGNAYAALVSPTGALTPISTGISNGSIRSVAINTFSQGMIGGVNNGTGAAFAAIVSPTGAVTPISLGISTGLINSVSILAPILINSQIPTDNLSGNNKTFAKYINKNAPQDVFYFIPSIADGSLASALESAAPTRNAFTPYTAGNNLFYFTTSLSAHLRNQHVQGRRGGEVAARTKEWKSDDGLLASMDLPRQSSYSCADPCSYTLWVEGIGAFARQKAQHQTPAFDPASGGAILALDWQACEDFLFGAGATYLYTHIHEKHGAGHSNINQEDLFIYSSWGGDQFYFDATLLGGLFQADQVRKIKMTGFEFKSTSHPKGWQLLPHIELGYNFCKLLCSGDVELTLNPFVMLDWANTWQNSYHEKGSGPFNAGQKSHHSSLLRTEASFRLYETIYFDCWNLIFEEKAGYVNVHSYKAGDVHAFLIGSPGAFTVTTLNSSQNLGVGQFMVIFDPNDHSYPTSTIFYQGEFSEKYQSHQVALELSWDF